MNNHIRLLVKAALTATQTAGHHKEARSRYVAGRVNGRAARIKQKLSRRSLSSVDITEHTRLAVPRTLVGQQAAVFTGRETRMQRVANFESVFHPPRECPTSAEYHEEADNREFAVQKGVSEPLRAVCGVRRLWVGQVRKLPRALQYTT